MSRFDLERLATDCDKDPALADRFALLGDDLGRWARLAREQGYELTLDEIQGLVAGRRELSDEDLDEVAGGWDGENGSGSSGGGGTGGEGGGG